MDERSIATSAIAALLSPYVDGWKEMIIWFIVAIVLLMADLRFGIGAAKSRGESIRVSRAVRRTVNKLVDYICWISIAWVFGKSFGKFFGFPTVPAIVMLGVCLMEFSSIVGNYAAMKGKKISFNIVKLFLKLIKKPDLEDCIEVKDKPEE